MRIRNFMWAQIINTFIGFVWNRVCRSEITKYFEELKVWDWIKIINLQRYLQLILKINVTTDYEGVKTAGYGLRGTYPAGVCLLLKPEKCYLYLPSPMHACPRHDPWKRLRTAKPCKGGTRIPDAIIGTNQLRETTLTENPMSSKVAGVEHKASDLVAEKRHVKNSRQKN
jgi:hypothetical protein